MATASPTLSLSAVGEEVEESLDAYYDACRAPTPSSSSSSFSDLEDSKVPFHAHASHTLGEAIAAITPVATGDALSQYAPLQGNVPRPLLLRQRRDSCHGTVPLPLHESEEAAAAAATAPQSARRPPSAASSGEVKPVSTSACGVTPAKRGAAGSTLIDQLQHATLPLGPTGTRWPRAAALDAAVFDFHLPVKHTPQISTSKGTRKSTIVTLTTRGRSSRSSSSPSVDHGAQHHARQRAVLFDVLCAVRQDATASCVAVVQDEGGYSRRSSSLSSPVGSTSASTTRTWCLSETVKAEARACEWPSGFMGALQELLDVANHVATAEALVHDAVAVWGESTHGDAPATTPATSSAADPTAIQDAVVALEAAGQDTLRRLARVLRQLTADFEKWVLQVQEYVVLLCEDAFACRGTAASWYDNEEEKKESSIRRDYAFATAAYAPGVATAGGEQQQRQHQRNEEESEEAWKAAHGGVIPLPYSVLDLVLAIQENSIPLQRCCVLVEESRCFDGLSTAQHEPLPPPQQQQQKQSVEKDAPPSSSPPTAAPVVSFADLAARLLDTLIIQASALQDTSTMDLYRFYVMLLLYAAWPYVLLCTAAIFGFVRGIDPPAWRHQLPRLFRSSFSHVRIGDAQRQYPTDVLSLMLNCVGYYNSFEVFSNGATVGAASDGVEAGGSRQTQWKLVKDATDARGSKGGRHKDLSERHVALAALNSARTFILHGLASFTRRKKQVALSRTPARASTPSQFKKAKPEQSGTAASPATSMSGQQWQKKSVKEILHYIMYESGGLREADVGPGDAFGEPTTSRAALRGLSGGDGDDAVDAAAEVGATVVAYAQENQDVRRRVVQLPLHTAAADVFTSKEDVAGDAGSTLRSVRATPLHRTPDAHHFVYYPTTIPLGFATMAREALAGQQQWQRRRDRAVAQREAAASAPTIASSTSFLKRQPRGVSAHSRSSEKENEEDEEGGEEVESTSDADVLQRRALSLWTLSITESATTPDVRFSNASAFSEEEALLTGRVEGGEDATYDADRRLSSLEAPLSGRRGRAHPLWINVTIPCARWVTTALLIPIGVVVQRLQERRLRDLFAVSLQAVHQRVVLGPAGWAPSADSPTSNPPSPSRRTEGDGGDGRGGKGGLGLLWANNEDVNSGDDGDLRGFSGAAREFTGAPRASADSSTAPATVAGFGSGALIPRSRTTSTAACSFLHALKLVVDVALCRDQERLVFGFLEQLHREPRWWARRWLDGGAGAFERLGTAMPTVSALFADALRGKRLGELVRLVVLPANEVRRDCGSSASAEKSSVRTTSSASGSIPGSTTPGATASTISSDMLDMFASFQLEFTFPEAFALILQPRDLSVYVQPVTNTTERSYQTFFWQRRRRLYVEEVAPSTTATAAKTGVAFADVWSYIFGYQCSLYYAQITLREHKKQLHRRDTQDSQVAQSMGQPGAAATRHLQYVARGLGSAYYTLNFAVDALLSFSQAEAMRAVYELERLLHKAMRDTRGLHSCMELCHALDTLLLQLHVVAFPARPAIALNARERAMASPAVEAVRGAVQRILEVALDPSRLPVSYISSSTRNSVEALVAAVTAAEELQSAFATRLHPLRVALTFNRYYGSPEETLSYRFR